MGCDKMLDRRGLLCTAAGAAGLGLASAALGARRGPAAVKGRIKQSVANWPFNVAGEKWDLARTCQVARQLGCKSVELVLGKDHEIVREHGLTGALSQINLDPPFVRGWNNPEFWPKVAKVTKTAIDEAAHYGSPNVICFTGFRAKDLATLKGPEWSDEEGADNCVAGLKQVMGYAEKKKVNICLEILNSRVPIHMVGVPGYQGDHTDYCMDIVRRVGSPRMKLLFDVFHVQIMDGDLISRIRQYKDYIAHYHTAGNPGRHELDDRQEINYPAVMQAIADTGFAGYVGHEFLPTGDPHVGLKDAIARCTV